jgi:hypothetical protein
MILLSAVEAVVGVHPRATAKEWSHAWCIERTWPPRDREQPIGEGATENEAWADAARRIK